MGSLPSPHSHRGGHLRPAHTHGGGHSRGGTVTYGDTSVNLHARKEGAATSRPLINKGTHALPQARLLSRCSCGCACVHHCCVALVCERIRTRPFLECTWVTRGKTRGPVEAVSKEMQLQLQGPRLQNCRWLPNGSASYPHRPWNPTFRRSVAPLTSCLHFRGACLADE